MEDQTKFMRMVDLLRTDRTARDRLLSEPEPLLRELGIDRSVLNEPHNQEAFQRAEQLLRDANITNLDDAISGLHKLGAAAKRDLPNGYELEVEPFGITLLEKVRVGALETTATGTAKCTYGPWDGCSPDVDF